MRQAPCESSAPHMAPTPQPPCRPPRHLQPSSCRQSHHRQRRRYMSAGSRARARPHSTLPASRRWSAQRQTRQRRAKTTKHRLTHWPRQPSPAPSASQRHPVRLRAPAHAWTLAAWGAMGGGGEDGLMPGPRAPSSKSRRHLEGGHREGHPPPPLCPPARAYVRALAVA